MSRDSCSKDRSSSSFWLVSMKTVKTEDGGHAQVEGDLWLSSQGVREFLLCLTWNPALVLWGQWWKGAVHPRQLDTQPSGGFHVLEAGQVRFPLHLHVHRQRFSTRKMTPPAFNAFLAFDFMVDDALKIPLHHMHDYAYYIGIGFCNV